MQQKMVGIGLSHAKQESFHNHPLSSEWEIPSQFLQEIQQIVMKNVHVSPKDVQKGVGIDFNPYRYH